jgi:3-hydroxybutyryl-CoA dehydrogenase
MKIGIIGSGVMGTGIAQVALMGGEQVALFNSNYEALDRAKSNLDAQFSKLVEKGKITEEKKTALVSQVSFVRYMNDLADCDWVIEAIVEDLAVKKAVFAELDALLPKTSILATNTSSLSVTAIASACKHPERVWGIHFFNPAFLMPLVEIIPGLLTAKEVTNKVIEISALLNKTPLVVSDFPGFISNRILMPMINEAILSLQENVAGVNEIDQIMKLGMAHPMGPLQLADYIGLDVCLSILNVLKDGFGNPKYAPAVLLVNMVKAGKLGVKSGEGFYKYNDVKKISGISALFAN